MLENLGKEIQDFSKKINKKEYELTAYIRSLEQGKSTKEENEWPIELTRKIKMLLAMTRIQNRLEYYSPTTPFIKQNQLFVEIFETVNTVLDDIKQSRSGNEVVIDFFKSVANQIIYLLTFTTHPGFFSTTTQPLQVRKDCLRRTTQLLQELDELERSSNVAEFAFK